MNNDYDMKIFLKNLTFLRKHNKLTKKEMAEILGIGIKSLNMIENGIVPKRLNINVLYRVAYTFDLSTDELFKKLI